jgi:predicted secreted protein
MAVIINGTNIVLYEYNGTTSTPFCASTNCVFQASVEQVEITSLASGSYKQFLNSQITWAVSCDGMIAIGDYDYKDIITKMQTSQPITIRFVVDNDNGGAGALGDTIFSGVANITSVNLSGPVEAVSTYSVSLLGTGNFTIS